MTQEQNPMFAAGIASAYTEGDPEEGNSTQPTVGASDAAADEARAGGDVDLGGAARDDDGVPVGRADAEADVRRSGADPDDV